jgi:LuxR family maltose regulon positive regulatory protein
MARPSMGTRDPGDGRHRTTAAVDSFINAKFHRPPTRGDWVDRARLIGKLDGATQLPVTLVSAPAGYGKTTLVSNGWRPPGIPGRRGSPSIPGTTTPAGC